MFNIKADLHLDLESQWSPDLDHAADDATGRLMRWSDDEWLSDLPSLLRAIEREHRKRLHKLKKQRRQRTGRR